jgi:deoxyadenosine/deoxycytidine kinase
MFISLEGNIGSGKSTLLDILKSSGLNIMQEPMSEWMLKGKKGYSINVLEEFYQDKDGYAYLFQSFCLRTRVRIMKNCDPTKLYILERGIESDGIFGAIQYQNGCMDEVEYAVYRYNLEQAKLDTPNVAKKIYIRTSIDTCIKRIAKRNRRGEEDISAAYLEQLENAHEHWLGNDDNVLVVNGEENFTDELVRERLIETIKTFIHY